jgi:hypothetical protein
LSYSNGVNGVVTIADAAQGPPAYAIILALIAVLLASGGMFWLLVRRWTLHRPWLDLQEFAQSNRMKLHGMERAERPEALSVFGDVSWRVLISMSDADTTVVQVETTRGPGAADESAPVRWNVLVRKLETTWPLTGLRPTAHARSILDFLPLANLYQAAPGERFSLYGAERAAARALSKSATGGLLPHDVGLVLHGHYLLLDFSTRPYDPLTIQRIDALAEQIVTHLPPPAGK